MATRFTKENVRDSDEKRATGNLFPQTSDKPLIQSQPSVGESAMTSHKLIGQSANGIAVYRSTLTMASRLPSQSDGLITPRTWNDMIATDNIMLPNNVIAKNTTPNGISIAHDGRRNSDTKLVSDDTRHQHNKELSNANKVNLGEQARHTKNTSPTLDLSESQNNNFDKIVSKDQLYAKDVEYRVAKPESADSSTMSKKVGHDGSFDLSDDLITPRTWSQMVTEDITVTSPEKDKPKQTVIASPLRIDITSDPLAGSIEFSWPTDTPRDYDEPSTAREGDAKSRIRSNQTIGETTSALSRLAWNVSMLKRELICMRQQDQKIFRHLLRNYETLGEMFDHVMVAMVTPSPSSTSCSPYPTLVSPRSTPSSPEKGSGLLGSSVSYAASVGDADLLRIVRDALAQSGSLDIPDIMNRLTPIRRRRSSAPPPMEYDDLPEDFGADDDCDAEFDDLLSLSCPVFKEPKARLK